MSHLLARSGVEILLLERHATLDREFRGYLFRPSALAEFRDQEGIEFGLVSGTDEETVDAYDVETDFADIGYHGPAERAVFVLDADGEIVYEWASDDPGLEHGYDGVAAAGTAA